LIHPSFECGFDRAREFAIGDDGTLRVRAFIYQCVGNDELLQSSSVKQLADIFKATEALLDKDYSAEINLLRTRTDPRLVLSKYKKKGIVRFPKLIDAQQLLDAAAQAYKASPDEHSNDVQAPASASFSPDKLANLVISTYGNSHELKTLRGKKLFAAKRGLVGLGPSDVREGDAVVVLFGVRTPFILRGNAPETEWCVIGDAYVSRITTMVVPGRYQKSRDFHIV
jgi:hypothetical protein